MQKWLQEIDRYACENVHKLLVGNKCDLASERKVVTEEAKDFADQLNLNFLETSAKDSTNVEEAFSKMAIAIKEKLGMDFVLLSFAHLIRGVSKLLALPCTYSIIAAAEWSKKNTMLLLFTLCELNTFLSCQR